MKRINFFLPLMFLFLITLPVFSKTYDIQFDTETYDFGIVDEGSEVNYTFVFKNTGTETLVIENVQPTCGCTIAGDWDKKIAPGGKGKIPVSFKTQHFNGEVVKIINVKTNIIERQAIQLMLKGRIRIPIEIVPLNTWLGEISKETKFLTGSFNITNNLDSPLKILEVTPPGLNVKCSLTVIEENKKFKLDYTISPPFDGEEQVSRKFTIKTDNPKYEYIYPQYFYFVPPPVRIVPSKVLFDMNYNKKNSITMDITVTSNIDKPIKIIDLSLSGGKGLTYVLKEQQKDKCFQVIITMPAAFVFPEKEKTFFTFKVENDPKMVTYSIPVEPANRY